MVPDQIKRETVIDAPPEVVWEVVTNPAYIREWWGATAEIDMRPGGEGTLSWEQFGVTVRLRVEQVDRPRLFAFRWVYPDGAEPCAENSLRVEFLLRGEGRGTRLRVIESGLSKIAWPAERKATYFDDHVRGWDRHVAALARKVTELVAASKER